ncbi:N-acetyllactosaminide beta-1,6-N-acetylglucosaminyl-transferase-like [Littorina saxatilis]|uniref:Beta-1,3-galactosyl-O-glycosyl-glycoprotein beta-1,6-N-acetylglucosaminyltransferase n=1 Tax=Littorina saxatilis TaxID=31220 RepID=A0AAN9C383_9CAEN
MRLPRGLIRGFVLPLAAGVAVWFSGVLAWTLKGPRHLKTLAVSENRLREFQSAADETRRLLETLLDSKSYHPPNVTDVNCTKFFLTADSEHQDGLDNYNDHKINYDEDEGPGSDNNDTMTERRPRNMREILTVTENCTRYVLESGFLFARVSEEELSFPLAFSILVHKDLDQVERLLRVLYRPHNVYCVHADRKSDADFQSGLRLIVSCLPNVFMVERSVDVRWAKMSVLEPELECMRRLLAHRAKWRYFINLTGQEFPLKTNKELVQILTALRGANDVGASREKRFHYRWRKSQPTPYILTMSKGDVHMLASRGYVDYVINSRVAHEMLAWLQDSFIPDETFFSTMNHNPQLGVPGSYLGSLENRNKEPVRSFKIWIFQNIHRCSGKFVRMVCIFGVGDLPLLVNADPYLIANKFSNHYQPLAYDCMEKWYFDKVQQENLGLAKPLDLSLYENSDIVKHRYTGPILIW